MKIADLLTSPPPGTGRSLDEDLAAVVRRPSKGELRCAAVEIPEATFELGPVGLQAVDQDKLRPVLTRLHQEVEGSRRAAVVLPSGWLRTHLLEFEDLPRRRQDIHDVVLWRLKKLLPVPPSTLRLATVAQRPTDGARRLLVLMGVERALADLEAVFESVEISPGIITPRVFAVTDSSALDGPVLVVQEERGFLSLMLLVDNEPRMVRTKLMAGSDWPVVERELGLTMGFITAKLGFASGIGVVISVEDESLGGRIAEWITGTADVSLAPTAAPSLAFEGTSVRDRVRPYRLDPVVNVLAGGVQ